MAADVPPLRPGDTFVLGDQDYRYGTGPIIVRVKVVVAVVKYDNEPWWHVEVEAANGTPENHGGWVSRHVYIREATIRQTRQPSQPEKGAHDVAQ